MKKGFFKLSIWVQITAILASLATVISTIIAICQFNNSNTAKKTDVPMSSGIVGTSETGTKDKINLKTSLQVTDPPTPQETTKDIGSQATHGETNENTPVFVVYKVDTSVKKYHNTITFGINALEEKDDQIILHFYVDNKSDKEVIVNSYKNMYLVDYKKQHYECSHFDSDDFSSVQSGERKEGKVVFKTSINAIGKNLVFKTSFFNMDPSEDDKDVLLPFEVNTASK